MEAEEQEHAATVAAKEAARAEAEEQARVAAEEVARVEAEEQERAAAAAAEEAARAEAEEQARVAAEEAARVEQEEQARTIAEAARAEQDEQERLAEEKARADVAAGESGKNQQTLPPGWMETEDEQGEKYYYNEVTEETSWELPNASPEVATETQAPPQVFYQAIGSYKARKADQLTITKGDTLTILDDGGKWWKAQNDTGETGKIPSNYVKKLAPTNIASVPPSTPTPAPTTAQAPTLTPSRSAPVAPTLVSAPHPVAKSADGTGAQTASQPYAPSAAETGGDLASALTNALRKRSNPNLDSAENLQQASDDSKLVGEIDLASQLKNALSKRNTATNLDESGNLPAAETPKAEEAIDISSQLKQALARRASATSVDASADSAQKPKEAAATIVTRTGEHDCLDATADLWKSKYLPHSITILARLPTKVPRCTFRILTLIFFVNIFYTHTHTHTHTCRAVYVCPTEPTSQGNPAEVQVEAQASVDVLVEAHVSAPAQNETSADAVLDDKESWEEVFTDDGTPYYVNSVTQETRWDRPSELGPALQTAVSLGAYAARKVDQLSMQKGETFDIVDASQKWYVVRNSEGKTGRVPSNYLKVVKTTPPLRSTPPPKAHSADNEGVQMSTFGRTPSQAEIDVSGMAADKSSASTSNAG